MSIFKSIREIRERLQESCDDVLPEPSKLFHSDTFIAILMSKEGQSDRDLFTMLIGYYVLDFPAVNYSSDSYNACDAAVEVVNGPLLHKTYTETLVWNESLIETTGQSYTVQHKIWLSMEIIDRFSCRYNGETDYILVALHVVPRAV